jgi:lipopolysaccharide biosynthesis glycosyltransferase
VQRIYLLIEDDDIPYIQHSKIQFINCNQFDFLIREGMNVTKRFSYMALTRCALSKILSEPKVLYLDVDTIVDGSIEELWNLALGSSVIGASIEHDCPYVNSGVLLMDLTRMSNERWDESLLRLLRKAKLLLPDQDAINLVFKGNIAKFPEKFNAVGSQAYDIVPEIIIRHFAGVNKPWTDDADPQDVAMWNKYKVKEISE